MTISKFTQFARLTVLNWIYVFIGTCLFLALQTWLLWHYQSPLLWQQYKLDIMHGFWVAILFDIKIMTLVLLPGYVVANLASMMARASRQEQISRFFIKYENTMTLLMFVIGILNYNYYKAFGTHFDYHLFMIKSGNWYANLLTALQYNPVLWLATWLIALWVLLRFAAKKIARFINVFQCSPNVFL